MDSKIAAVVLGAHRSGTSAMARTLALMGFELPKSLMPPQADNPLGFWESASISDLNDEILAARDTDWSDVFSMDEGPLLSNSGAIFRARAEALIEQEFSGAHNIVLKDPRMNQLGDFWSDVLDRSGYRCAYVVMVRHPLEVAQSLCRRNGFHLDRALLIWLANMLSAERSTRGRPRALILYDELLQDWRTALDRIETVLDGPLPRRTATSELAVGRYLDAQHRHHRVEGALTGKGELYSLVNQAFAWFLSAARGEAQGPEALDRLRERLDVHKQVFSGVVADLRDATRSAQDGLAAADRRNAELEAAARQAERDEGSARAKLEEASRAVETLTAALDEAAADASSLREDLAARIGEVERARAELETTREALAQEQEARATAHRERVEISDELACTRTKASEREAEAQAALHALQVDREHLQAAERNLRAADDRTRTLLHALATEEQALARTTTALAAAEDRAEDLETQLKLEKEDLAAARREQVELRAEVARARADEQLAGLRARELAAALAATAAQAEEADRRVVEARDAALHHVRRLAQVRSEAEAARKELAAWRSEQEELALILSAERDHALASLHHEQSRSADMARQIAYIQSRFWWRGFSFVRSLLRPQLSWN